MTSLTLNNQYISKLNLPAEIKQLIPEIYEGSLQLFQTNRKSPIDIITNDLFNSFFHTYIAPIIQVDLGLTRSKEDVKKYVNQHCKNETGKTMYEKRWNYYQQLVKKFKKDDQLKIVLVKLMSQNMYETRKNSIYKIKLNALLTYVRHFLPEDMTPLPRINQLWQYIFGLRLPTKKNIQQILIDNLDLSEISTTASNPGVQNTEQFLEDSELDEDFMKEEDDDDQNFGTNCKVNMGNGEIKVPIACQHLGIKLQKGQNISLLTNIPYLANTNILNLQQVPTNDNNTQIDDLKVFPFNPDCYFKDNQYSTRQYEDTDLFLNF